MPKGHKRCETVCENQIEKLHAPFCLAPWLLTPPSSLPRGGSQGCLLALGVSGYGGLVVGREG